MAPLYAQLLVDAAQRLGPTEAFYRLWPVSMPPVPWWTVVINFYCEVAPPHIPLQAGLNRKLCIGIACLRYGLLTQHLASR